MLIKKIVSLIWIFLGISVIPHSNSSPTKRRHHNPKYPSPNHSVRPHSNHDPSHAHHHHRDPIQEAEDQDYDTHQPHRLRSGVRTGLLSDPNSASPSHPLSSTSIILHDHDHSQTKNQETLPTPFAPNPQSNPPRMPPYRSNISSNLSPESSRLLTRNPRHAKSFQKTLTHLAKKFKFPSLLPKVKQVKGHQPSIHYSFLHQNNPLSPRLPGEDVTASPESETPAGFPPQVQFFPNGDRYQGSYDSQGDLRTPAGGTNWIPLEELESGGWKPLVRVKPIPRQQKQKEELGQSDRSRSQYAGGPIRELVETVPPVWGPGQGPQGQRSSSLGNEYTLVLPPQRLKIPRPNPFTKTTLTDYVDYFTVEDVQPPPPRRNPGVIKERVKNVYDEVQKEQERDLDLGQEKAVIDEVTYYDEIVEDDPHPPIISSSSQNEPVYSPSTHLTPSRAIPNYPSQFHSIKPDRNRKQGMTPAPEIVPIKSHRFTLQDANSLARGERIMSSTSTSTTPPPEEEEIQEKSRNIVAKPYRTTTRRPARRPRPPLVYRTTPKPAMTSTSTATTLRHYSHQESEDDLIGEGNSNKFYYAVRKNEQDWQVWGEDLFLNPS